MRIALTTDDLLSSHAMACVDYRAYSIARERKPEARPSRPGVVFVRRRKQLRTATKTTVRAILLVIDILARKRSLSTFFLGYRVLLVA